MRLGLEMNELGDSWCCEGVGNLGGCSAPNEDDGLTGVGWRLLRRFPIPSFEDESDHILRAWLIRRKL